MRMKFKLFYWPILTSIWITLTFMTTYVISVCLKLVNPLFPYISETGAYHPASSVFGILINLGALFVGIIFYIRYRQVDIALKTGKANLTEKWNTAGFWLGNVIAFGICLVANFQSDISPNGTLFVLGTHLTGAVLAFGIGAVYMILQTRIAFGIRPVYEDFPEYQTGMGILYFRIFLTILFFVFFLGTAIGAGIAEGYFVGTDYTWWTSADGGYVARVVSAFFEWFMVLDFIVYILTMEKEFKAVTFEGIRFTDKCTYKNTLE
ncbi:hypothetical protein ILUMI_06076 [Ignelater luminosus]|uniref:CWH43-like N-terminal domain-containing protein n=1 Tax=Ignelater luminosus TaxID=2038154 RepID=A0A8K0D5Y9_IGNLU|nr:hypothetical protein ILUMI_06076 [Ignelater luminosus]